MEEELKAQVFEFINERIHNLAEVVNVEERDLEYVVDCILICRDATLHTPYVNKEKTCLVNKKAFNSWLSMKNAITWL